MQSASELEKLQNLIIEITYVERNHRIPGSERRENVVEHSFSVAMLCWRVFDIVKPPLDLSRILRYALVHDFPERGQREDINTYAPSQERMTKKEREEKETSMISEDMKDFSDLNDILRTSGEQGNEEVLFVWCVDKLQAKVLGHIDNWRPYRLYGVTYEQYCAKDKEILDKCPDYLRELFSNLFLYFQGEYYDQPTNIKRN